MAAVSALYAYAIAVGFVSAGMTGSAWALATGESPKFRLLLEPSLFFPFRTAAVVLHAPLAILNGGIWNFLAKPVAGVVFVAASLGWSFLQGVFILTQLFGLK
jgi:hypothetical protein